MSKILLFIEDCGSSGLSQDLSDKNANYEIWNYSLGSTLQFALFKIKIRLLESDQKCLHHGSSTKPLFSLYKRDNTTKKKEKKNYYGSLDILMKICTTFSVVLFC